MTVLDSENFREALQRMALKNQDVELHPENIGFFPVLSDKECSKVHEIVNECSRMWAPIGRTYRTDHFLYTLGAATYIHGRKDVRRYRTAMLKYNGAMYDKFSFLYKILERKVSRHVGDAVISPDLGPPGFHVIGPKPGRTLSPQRIEDLNQTVAATHYDGQGLIHQNVWSKFKEVDFENLLSFTVTIALPFSGGGLDVWDENIPDSLLPKMRVSKRPESLPIFVPYTVGEAFFFIAPVGRIKHRIANLGNCTGYESRVTLQAHGIKCDGVWQLFF